MFLKWWEREHAFKLPQRITLSEIRRQSWHTDFFNPEVPLHTIGEKIPHAKGHDLLTLLQENKVPIPRAIWYVRGLGGNETVRELFTLSMSFHICTHSKECVIVRVTTHPNTVWSGLTL